MRLRELGALGTDCRKLRGCSARACASAGIQRRLPRTSELFTRLRERGDWAQTHTNRGAAVHASAEVSGAQPWRAPPKVSQRWHSDFGGWIILCWGGEGCLVHCRIFGSIPGLFPQDASNIPLPPAHPNYDNLSKKCLQTLPNFSWGGCGEIC